MGEPKITVLISSAGSRAAEAIIESLVFIRDQLRLVGTNSIADFTCLNELDVAYLVPPTQDAAAFKSRMLGIVAAERPDVILNGRDEEIEALAALAQETGCLFLGPSLELAPVFADKHQTWQFALSKGLPFAQTAATHKELDSLLQRHVFPLIGKPRRGGHASKGVFLVSDRAQADRMLHDGNVVFQPYMGPAGLHAEMIEWGKTRGMPWIWNPFNIYYMLDFVVGAAGQAVSWCATRAERSGSNIQRLEMLEDPSLNDLVHKHIEALGRSGHYGPVNVQGYLDQAGKFCAFEWNARFVGSVDGYALLGKNLVLDALSDRFPSLAVTTVAPAASQVVFRPMRYKTVPLALIRSLTLHGRCETWVGSH